MATKKAGRGERSVSDTAVAAKTGRNWSEWFRILDKAGACKMAHRDIARLLYGRHKVPSWWAQMVTVEYESARGMRAVHQTASGYVASVSRTFDATVGALFKAWTDARLRRRWLGPARFTITTATRNQCLRMVWADGTRTEVHFYPRGAGRCQMPVQHSKLGSARSVAAMKKSWSAAFDKLSKVVMAAS